jgi:hypothetical protein
MNITIESSGWWVPIPVNVEQFLDEEHVIDALNQNHAIS